MPSDLTTAAEQQAAQPSGERLEGGAYEIIRNRLNNHADELRRRLDELNDLRKLVFGSIDVELLGTERITTRHNCVPRDMASVGNRLLFGYNVHFGLKSEIDVPDVFAVYEFSEGKFHEHSLELIGDERFKKDFRDLYRYYKNATFAEFFAKGPYLFMKFFVGNSVDDFKTFKWAVQGDSLVYVDNRSDHELRYPPQHEFEWKRTVREQHKGGAHPHISIADLVFVECIGGDLTIKIEDNTDSGEGVYSEPVKNPDQTLDDAEIHYAVVGNLILLRIRPYQENAFRYFVVNEKLGTAVRLDAIQDACVLLPDDHGLIFSNGYYLQTGDYKTFDSDLEDMIFERRIPAPNGEDYLFAFYNRRTGVYILLQYNLIDQQVETPIVCHGFTLFEAGELILFKTHDDPQKHHAVQIWRTPFVGEGHEPETETDTYLYRIGNRDVVRGMAECHEILNLVGKDDAYAGLYVDLVKLTGDVLDTYFWIDNEEAANLAEPLGEIREAASAAISEFEKVVQVRRNTAKQTAAARSKARETIKAVDRKRFEHINEFVASLADLRTARGEVIGLRELRYSDGELIDALETEVAETSEKLARRCVQFLLRDDALEPYRRKVAEEKAKIPDLEKVADAKKLQENIHESAAELEMLIEIVSNLRIDDATHRTTIIDRISDIFAGVNAARTALKNRTKQLMSVEGVAEFNSQLKLLNQAVVNYLDVCDTPEKCEEYLTRVMIQIEELEGRFAEFDEFVVQLSEKRDEIYTAFEQRKLALVEARNRRAQALMSAAERILTGIRTRVDNFEEINRIHGYFASDLMIEKVRDICRQLEELDDSVKVDDIQSRLKTIREDAVRRLKDRQELFVGGENVIKLGRHQFNVNVQQLDLTTVLRDDRMQLHLTGTKFFETIDDPELLATRPVWDQEVVSENKHVYRGEYLAFVMLNDMTRDAASDASSNGRAADADALTPARVVDLEPDELVQRVQQFMGPRYSEGYVKGVHDRDAAKILRTLCEMHTSIGLLRFHARARALAHVFWDLFDDEDYKALIAAKLRGVRTITRLFPHTSARAEYIAELADLIRGFVEEQPLFHESLVDEAAEYLFHEMMTGDTFVVSRPAAETYASFKTHLGRHDFDEPFAESYAGVRETPPAAYRLLRDWVTAYLESGERRAESGGLQSRTRSARIEAHGKEKASRARQEAHSADSSAGQSTDQTDSESAAATATVAAPPVDDARLEYADEVAALLLAGDLDKTMIVDAEVETTLEDMAGDHAVIENGVYRLHYNRFMDRLNAFQQQTVPRFQCYVELKKDVVDKARDDMQLDEFRPRVLTSFVRNRLIDSVYLPLIGDNLAKQMGAAGEDKRTDRMGMLLLISPPGYGKTTLMEYVANRLGIVFMKINGPAIGHHVTSLDPEEAPNASAREEVEKLNLALEMGDNVMIYLDDIQHTNPELLQKFISLCDATRKIEGVWKGRPRTYDLRGRKVAVVMAGNPYTESGDKFQIPDMLANRADVYNLGEIIGDSREAFEMSYLENSLTSNPTLSRLSSRSQKDVYAVIKMAEHGRDEGVDLEGSYSLEELNEMIAVMQKLLKIRDVILSVNREYIRSAATADEYRTEPAFLLQGSYRNMNRIAERVAPIMNDRELQTLINSNYENDAQTLTSGAEANMLKFKEITGQLSEDEAERWQEIKRTFGRNLRLKGINTDDQFGQAIAQLSSFADGLDGIREAMSTGVAQLSARQESNGFDERADQLLAHLGGVKSGLDDIREAMSNGVARMFENGDEETSAAGLATEQMTEQFGALREGLLQIRETLAGGIDRLAELVDRPFALPANPPTGGTATPGAPAVPPAAAPAQQKITVVNKIPPTLFNVLEQQFKLMEGWMKPILALSDANHREIEELKNVVDECLTNYAALLARVKEARRRARKESAE